MWPWHRACPVPIPAPLLQPRCATMGIKSLSSIPAPSAALTATWWSVQSAGQGGLSREVILEKLQELIDSARSFLVPADFDYLRRGGRLSPLVSHVGKAANLTPIMTQIGNGERLTVAGIRRGYPHAVKYITEQLVKAGVGQGWQVQISHAGAPDRAELALKVLSEAIPEAEYRIYPLSPAFITQGGPGCVAVQYNKL